jgi:DNA-binding ferritin-like protein
VASRRKSSPEVSRGPRSPAHTPEERENQLIEAAVNLAERQLQAGEASAQVITHYLKLGSSREKLEQQRLKHENALLVTKREVMESEKRTEELVADALKAMQAYTGNAPQNEQTGYDEYEE